MKIGIIGLGEIAKKAYLPIISQISNVEFHLYTRNQDTLAKIGKQYRFHHLYESIEALIDSGISGVFIHAATKSHEAYIEKLLAHNIHVYVDKPITDNYTSAEKLTNMAREKDLILLTGFNRRYAPSYQSLQEKSKLQAPNMVLMEKNRANMPQDVRTAVFDDFIHVIDTIRYIFPHEVQEITVQGKVEDGLLHHVVVQFIAKEGIAVGVMNRNSGSNDEKVEIISPLEKRTVYNVADTVVQKDGFATTFKQSDWESTLRRRGFEWAVSNFLDVVRDGGEPLIAMEDALETHRICELIVKKLEEI